MARRYSREEVWDRLKQTLQKEKPLLGAGCSCGLIARCAEDGGADLVICYSTGKSRLMGLPTTRMGDSNAVTFEMVREIWNIIQETPIIAGIDAADPYRLDLQRLLLTVRELGASGIINFPSIVGLGEYYRRRRDKVGLGFDREVQMVRAAREMGLFTMAYIYDAEDVAPFIQAGVDCVVAHVGPTEGGTRGVSYEGTREGAVAQVHAILERARNHLSSVLRLAHGGPFAEPEDIAILYQQTPAQGFVGASSIERIPVEKAVTDVVRRFKNHTLTKGEN
jgi:predicted TIM-barrel enzyme